MELWTEVRHRVLTGELSKRAACREYGIHWQTLTKMLQHAEPPGYRQTKARPSKLDAFLPTIDEILTSDRQVHRKQRHTSKRIFERLRDEHGYDGGWTLVKDAVRAWRQQHQEVFLPLSHPPGEAQVDFGFADVWLDGELTKVALVDDPRGFSPENDSSIEELTAEPDESLSAQQKTPVPFEKQRPQDPALYNPDGAMRVPMQRLVRDLYNPRVAFQPIGMERHYGVSNLNANNFYPSSYASRCCVLVPTNDPCLAYKTIAFDTEWCLLSQEEALRAIAGRYRTEPAQTVYIFQARQAGFYSDDTTHAYATVRFDGSVTLIRQN